MLTPAELRSFPWSNVSYLVVNEGEILDLLAAFGQSQSQSNGGVVEFIRALANSKEFGGKVRIVCTLGAQGVMYATDGQAGEVLTKPAGKLEKAVKDTTGAGDCFLGYLAAGLMRGESVEEALDTCLAVRFETNHILLGSAGLTFQACAICVENEGAMDSMPSLSEASQRKKQ